MQSGGVAATDRADEAAGDASTEYPSSPDCGDGTNVSEPLASDDDGEAGSRRTSSLGRDSDNDGDGDAVGAPSTRRSSLANRDAPSSTRRPSFPKPRPSLQRSNSSLHQSMRDLRRNLRRQSSQSFRALKRQSSTFLEGINDSLPATPSGWALLALGAASVGLQYELHVQEELTAPPIVFCQNAKGSALNGRMDRLFDRLSRKGDASGEEEGIFSRKVTPSLFIGTRGLASSAAAYALGGGKSKQHVQRIREVMTMGADGALIVLDWEIPLSDDKASQQTIDIKRANSIDKPVVLLLHGLNNDSSFGYIRSMMRTATERGWIAVGMNFRGQDGERKVKNATPRGYNAGYTGDIRGVIQQLEYRLKKKKRRTTQQTARSDEDLYIGGPIFLLGYSLGANIVTKYLGEESLHGTLPKCIGGGAAMGNPLHIHSGTIAFPWNMLLGAGVKRSILQNYNSFKRHHDPGFRRAIMKKTLLAPTIGKLDDAAAPYLIRNDPHPPYTPRIGFKDGDEYWWESSSHRYVGQVEVPLLKISAQDDFLVFGQFARKLNHCLENPNVVVVKTRCGGHLGWQESPPPSSKRKGGSWSDAAVADFIEALLQMREEDRRKREGGGVNNDPMDFRSSRGPKMRSRL